MSTEDVEAIRQRMMSLLVDSKEIKHKVDRIGLPKDKTQRDAQIAIRKLADRIDREARELYHLLPEHLRPDEMPRPQKPREPRPEGPDGRKGHGPKPGGPIPREVRWPGWTIDQILALADAFKEKHGKWPNSNSGRITDAAPDTWNGIDIALQRGNRNLPGGASLARLLSERRGARTRSSRPPFDLEAILTWADEHHARTQTWPTLQSGPVIGAPDETWCAIDHALRRGSRGLPAGSSLARLLAERRGAPYYLGQQPLTEAQILTWAEAHHSRTERWPTRASGAIAEAPHEDWSRIDNALINGTRSLPGGSSLARLLATHKGVRNRKALPHFEVEKILQWADRHYERQGRWPTCWSREIEDAPGETWNAVDAAFKQGTRGLSNTGYRSLAHLLDERRGRLRRRGNRPAERVPPAVP